jgi:hypothetical protein
MEHTIFSSWRGSSYISLKTEHIGCGLLYVLGFTSLVSFSIKPLIQVAIFFFSSIPYSSFCFSSRTYFIRELVITLVSYGEFFHCIFAFVVLMSIYNTSRRVSSNTVSVNNKFWEELTPNFPLIRYGSYRKRRVQSSSIFVGVFVAAVTVLRSLCLLTTGGIHMQTHKLMAAIYEVRRWDEFRYHDIHTKFHNDWFRHSKVNSHSQTHRQYEDRISQLQKSTLKSPSAAQTLLYWLFTHTTTVRHVAHARTISWVKHNRLLDYSSQNEWDNYF